MDTTHADTWAAETHETTGERAWYAWYDAASKLAVEAGQILDGDGPSGDPYNLDAAYEAWEAGTTPAQYIAQHAPAQRTPERVTTHALAVGDTVEHFGMLITLGERGERLNPSTGRLTVWFHGRVTNPDDVDPALVPVSFRSGCADCGPGAHWQIQGNDLATWSRIPA